MDSLLNRQNTQAQYILHSYNKTCWEKHCTQAYS